jgi:hypothetical protein
LDRQNPQKWFNFRSASTAPATASPPVAVQASQLNERIKRAVDIESVSPSEDDSLRSDVIDRKKLIVADLQQPYREAWEGDYFAHDLHVLVSRSGAVAISHLDIGVAGDAEGSIERQRDGSLRIHYRDFPRNEFTTFPIQLVPVRWGERHYLIEPGLMAEFVAEINSGYEPRTLYGGGVLLADGDEFKPVDGVPQLPERWLRAIRTQSSTAHILQMQPMPERTKTSESGCEKSWRLRLSVDGPMPKVGDKLYSQNPDGYLDATVQSVSGKEADAVGGTYDENCLAPKAVPDRSWLLELRPFDPVRANARIERAKEEYIRDVERKKAPY